MQRFFLNMCRLLGCLVALATANGSTATMEIAVRGKPADVVVLLAAPVSPSQAYAAQELTNSVAKMTDVLLPVRTSLDEAVNGRVIWVEHGESALGDDGFGLKCSEDGLHIVGGRRGVLYGVYEVLQRFGGVDWFASWHEVVPRLDVFAVPADLHDEQRPAFDYRELHWFDAFNGDFAARMRINGDSQRLSNRHGGPQRCFGGGLGLCHTFRLLVPPDEFFDAHPEYFSLVGGKRKKDHSQLCLTNPEVFSIVVDRVKAAIRRDPEARYFGVSQNDWKNYCECPGCAKVDAEEGSHSGSVVRFVNAVAAEVEKEFPGRIIETLAYHYTRHPPRRTRLRGNVMPCLCTYECDFSRPLATSPYPENVKFVQDLNGWAEKTDRLFIWDYAVNFKHYAHAFPNFGAMQENLKLFRSKGVVGIFSLGDYQGRHADLAELKTWMLAKWMWNPDLPAKPLLDRFFVGYYGKAAPFAEAYFRLQHEFEGKWVGDNPQRALTVAEPVTARSQPDSFLEQSLELWRQAERAVEGESPVYAYNVRMGAFPSVYTQFERNDRMLWVTRHPEKFGGGPEKIAACARWLLKRMDEAGNIRIAEGSGKGNQRFRERLIRRATADAMTAADRAKMSAYDAFESDVSHCRKMVDPLSEYGRSIRLPCDHFSWSTKFPLNRVAYDGDSCYKVRLRLKVDVRPGAPPDAEVFWAGVHDPSRRKSLGAMTLKAKECAKGWEWHEVCRLTPNDESFLWIAPGRFDRASHPENPAHSGVSVDAVEFTRLPQEFRRTEPSIFNQCQSRP